MFPRHGQPRIARVHGSLPRPHCRAAVAPSRRAMATWPRGHRDATTGTDLGRLRHRGPDRLFGAGRAGVSAPTRAPLRLVRRAGFWPTRPISWPSPRPDGRQPAADGSGRPADERAGTHKARPAPAVTERARSAARSDPPRFPATTPEVSGPPEHRSFRCVPHPPAGSGGLLLCRRWNLSGGL
jgi:hypothetical protein